MSKKPSLAALKGQIDAERRPQLSVVPPKVEADDILGGEAGRIIRGKRYPTYREGKVPISGYFSPELSKALHQMALDESVNGQPRKKVQALVGEALDLLMQSRGKHPFGER
jgi:antitoxin-like ribbon-helix-helix protein